MSDSEAVTDLDPRVVQAIAEGPNGAERFNDEWKRRELFATRIAILAAECEREACAKEKDQAYLERNHLVAALSRLYPSGLRTTNIPGWSVDWHGCCMIDLPSGQISYHFHDSHAHLFAHLQPYRGEWDGHDKDCVHTRLATIRERGKP